MSRLCVPIRSLDQLPGARPCSGDWVYRQGRKQTGIPSHGACGLAGRGQGCRSYAHRPGQRGDPEKERKPGGGWAVDHGGGREDAWSQKEQRRPWKRRQGPAWPGRSKHGGQAQRGPPEVWPCGTVLPTDRSAVSAGCPSRWLDDGLQGGRLDVGRPEAAWGLLQLRRWAGGWPRHPGERSPAGLGHAHRGGGRGEAGREGGFGHTGHPAGDVRAAGAAAWHRDLGAGGRRLAARVAWEVGTVEPRWEETQGRSEPRRGRTRDERNSRRVAPNPHLSEPPKRRKGRQVHVPVRVSVGVCACPLRAHVAVATRGIPQIPCPHLFVRPSIHVRIHVTVTVLPSCVSASISVHVGSWGSRGRGRGQDPKDHPA